MKRAIFIFVVLLSLSSAKAQKKPVGDSAKATDSIAVVQITLTEQGYAYLQQLLLVSKVESWEIQKYLTDLAQIVKRFKVAVPAKKETH